MSEFKLTTVEEFEAATERLLETGAKVGADAWQFRAGPAPDPAATDASDHRVLPLLHGRAWTRNNPDCICFCINQN